VKFNASLDIYLRASQATARKTADDCNKINIHVALLRAMGVPARYHSARVEKEVLRRLVPDFLYDHLPTNVGHFWCEGYVTGKWIACEALTDKPFYEGMLKAGWIQRERIPGIDWDGKKDLVLLRHWIGEDGNIFSRYEDLLALARKEGLPPKWICRMLEWLPAYFAGRQTDKIRKG
jgi:hypothetical protein